MGQRARAELAPPSPRPQRPARGPLHLGPTRWLPRILPGRAAGRAGAGATRQRVVVFFLVTQAEHGDAMGCGLAEYPIGAECCPMCAAGFRVFKNCTAVSSTTCIPCAEGTYTDRPSGLEHCRKCKLCDKGANLVAEVACTSTKNTVCGCPLGYFCSRLGTESCDFCQRYTVCSPGTVLKERGTKNTDNVCEACPPGTFSAANMSHSCIPWPRVKQNSLIQGEERAASNAAACSNCSRTAIIACTVLTLAAGAACFGYIWQRRKRENHVPQVQESRSGLQGQALVLTVENGDKIAPVLETNANSEDHGFRIAIFV